MHPRALAGSAAATWHRDRFYEFAASACEFAAISRVRGKNVVPPTATRYDVKQVFLSQSGLG